MKKYILIVIGLVLFSCATRQEKSKKDTCYELIKNINYTKENSVTITSLSDIEKVMKPEKVLFLTLNLREKIEEKHLYKFKNIKLLQIYYNSNIDFNTFQLSKYKYICSLELNGRDKMLSENFEMFFKNLNYLPNLRVDEYGVLTKKLIKYLPQKIDFLEVIFKNVKSKKIDSKLLDINSFVDLNIDKIEFKPNSKRSGLFQKKDRKTYPKKPSYSYSLRKTLKANDVLKCFLSINNLKELIIKKAHIDILTSDIGKGRNLETLKFFNCYLTKIPQELGNLNKLKTLTLYNEEVINKNYRYPEIEIVGQIHGLKELKNIYFFNIALSKFPELSETSKIKNFIYIGDGKLKGFPEFLGQSKKTLKTLTWSKTKVKKIPDYVNDLQLDVLNLNNNQLTTIDNIIDGAINAVYFAYDINNIPFKDRKRINDSIKLKKRKPKQEIEKIADSIYFGLKNNLLFRRTYIGYSFKESFKNFENFYPESQKDNYKRASGVYNDQMVNDFYHYINLSKKYNLYIGGFRGDFHACFDWGRGLWSINNTNFEDYSEILKFKPEYPFYFERDKNCEEKSLKEDIFWGNENTKSYSHWNDSDIKREQTEKIVFTRSYNQKSFNKIIKTKGLKNIVSHRISVDSIPQCFYELNLDTIDIDYFDVGKPFLKDYKYPSNYFRAIKGGNVPVNIEYLYIGNEVYQNDKEIELPKLKVLVKDCSYFNEKENFCNQNTIFPSQYLKATESIDSIYIVSSNPYSRVCFEKKWPKIDSKYLSIGYDAPKKLFPVQDIKETTNIKGLPKFAKGSKLETIVIKGKFINPYISNSVFNVKGLKKIKLENISVIVDVDDEGYIKVKPDLPIIHGLEKIFKKKDLEELTLINFKINELPKGIQQAKNLKKLVIKRNEDYAVPSDAYRKIRLNKLSRELLALNNLEELYLEVKEIDINLDFSLLPKLKKITITGVKSLPKELINKLEKNNVKVNITRNF